MFCFEIHLEGGAYSDVGVNDLVLTKGQDLFEVRHLLEEIRYLLFSVKAIIKLTLYAKFSRNKVVI